MRAGVEAPRNSTAPCAWPHAETRSPECAGHRASAFFPKPSGALMHRSEPSAEPPPAPPARLPSGAGCSQGSRGRRLSRTGTPAPSARALPTLSAKPQLSPPGPRNLLDPACVRGQLLALSVSPAKVLFSSLCPCSPAPTHPRLPLHPPLSKQQRVGLACGALGSLVCPFTPRVPQDKLP